MAEDLIEREILIEASRDRVWAVLTDAAEVTSWFGEEEQAKAVQENTDGWTSELAELKEHAERPAA